MSCLVSSRGSRRVAYLLSRGVDDGILVSVLKFFDSINISNDAFGAHQASRDSLGSG